VLFAWQVKNLQAEWSLKHLMAERQALTAAVLLSIALSRQELRILCLALAG
jgi:hypothetical protein